MTANVFQRPSGALRVAARLVVGAVGVGVFGYATYAAGSWLRYGRVSSRTVDGSADPLLDALMPAYEVAERHQIRVGALPEITLAAAGEQELLRAPVVHSVFKARELILGSRPSQQSMPAGLLAQTLSMGWRLLAEVPGREVTVGAVTRPWEANVVFRGLPPEEFAAFAEPGYVKIIWSLRADALDANHSILRTETRAVATDAAARARFRVLVARLTRHPTYSPAVVASAQGSCGTPVRSDDGEGHGLGGGRESHVARELGRTSYAARRHRRSRALERLAAAHRQRFANQLSPS